MGLRYLRYDLDALKFTCLNRQKTSLRVYSSLFSDIHVLIFVSQNHKIDVNVLTLRGFIKLKILNSSAPFRASNSHLFCARTLSPCSLVFKLLQSQSHVQMFWWILLNFWLHMTKMKCALNLKLWFKIVVLLV